MCFDAIIRLITTTLCTTSICESRIILNESRSKNPFVTSRTGTESNRESPQRFTPMKTNQTQHWPPDGAGRHRLHVHKGDPVAAAEDGRLVVRQRGDGAAAVRRLEDVRRDGKDCRVTRRTTTSLQAFPAGVRVYVCFRGGRGLRLLARWASSAPLR